MTEPRYTRFSSAKYVDENGEDRDLYELRSEIETDCIDFASYKQQGREWLRDYGKYVNGKQSEQYRSAIGQYLFMQCLSPLQAGFSRTNVMSAVGMYIGMSLVCKDVKGQYNDVMKSGCDNLLSVLGSNEKTKGSKLYKFVEKMRDKQATKVNHGRMPYTPMSASMEYLRIENAAYALMRVPTEQMTPPTEDHITEAFYDYKTIAGRDDVTLEVVNFYKRRLDRFQRAANAWDDMTDAEKKAVYTETIRLDADKAKEILYYMAIDDGVSPEMIKDNVSHIIGNALVRDSEIRKNKRHEQRSKSESVVDEIKDAYRNGLDAEVTGIADVFNQTSYGVGSATLSDFESVFDCEIDDNGVVHSVVKDKWDGTFKNTIGNRYNGEFEAREPLTVATAPLAMARAMGAYLKGKGNLKCATDMLSAITFVEGVSSGQNIDAAYSDAFGNMFVGKSHDDVREMRNLVTDVTHIVDQMKRDGVDMSQVSSICSSGYRAAIFNAYLDDNMKDLNLKEDVKAALTQSAFSDVNMCISHEMDKQEFMSNIIPARCRVFCDVLKQGKYCSNEVELKEATKSYGRFLTMFYNAAEREKRMCEKNGVSYQNSKDVFVRLISNYSADMCSLNSKDELEMKIDEYNNRVAADSYRYYDVRTDASYHKEDNEVWYNTFIGNNEPDGRGSDGRDDDEPEF